MTYHQANGSWGADDGNSLSWTSSHNRISKQYIVILHYKDDIHVWSGRGEVRWEWQRYWRRVRKHTQKRMGSQWWCWTRQVEITTFNNELEFCLKFERFLDSFFKSSLWNFDVFKFPFLMPRWRWQGRFSWNLIL